MFDTKKAHLLNLRDRYNELTNEEATQCQQLQASARETQRIQFLKRKFINPGQIPDIGRGRTAALAANGILTAFDIEEYRVRHVPRFGPELKERLLQWRRTKDAEFNSIPAADTPGQEKQALKAKYEKNRKPIEMQLLSGVRDLKSIAADADSQLAGLYEQIKSALGQLAQADADTKVIPPGI